MRDAVLCTGNFRAATGYAWVFINELFSAVAREAGRRDMRAFVAYPKVDGDPPGLVGSTVVEMDARLAGWSSILATLRFVRRERVRVLYLTDQRGWHVAYTMLRLVGVRRIVVHAHTSYESWDVSLPKRVLRRVRRWLPGSTPDLTVCVSDHVAAKTRHLGHVPADTVLRIWNSLPPLSPPARSASRLRVVCCARAMAVKGVHHLLHAFDRVRCDAELIYIGDGPEREAWERLRGRLSSRDRIHFLGYRDDAAEIVGGADVAVVPSTYEEAFGLAALEPMAQGVPVIVSDRGGLPEIVAHDESGLVVPAADVNALTAALERLLSDPDERRRMGEAGIRRARRLFARDDAVRALQHAVFGGSAAEPRGAPGAVGAR